MNTKEMKEKGLELFNDIKEQAVNLVDKQLPKLKTLYSQTVSTVADAMTKRAQRGAKIYLESDGKGNYKITVEGKKKAVRDAFEKLLKENWLCNSK